MLPRHRGQPAAGAAGGAMRRGLPAAVLLVVLALVASGCTKPPGVDGNLIDDWPQMAEAKVPEPVADACYMYPSNTTEFTIDFATLRPPVRCTEPHNVETVHVGAVTGADAASSAPPAIGGPGRRVAYEECAQSAKSFLGDDWRLGRLSLFVTLPKQVQWEGGARWFRCDLVANSDTFRREIVVISESQRGGLSGARTYGLTCSNIVANSTALESITATPCATAHNGEFVGIYVAPDVPYPPDPERFEQSRVGCLKVIAAFVGIPDDGTNRTGLVRTVFSRVAWDLGNRATLCYIWRGAKTNTGSLRGVGVAGVA
jgi:hypothetical protein